MTLGAFETSTNVCCRTVLAVFQMNPNSWSTTALGTFEKNTYPCDWMALVEFDTNTLVAGRLWQYLRLTPLWLNGNGAFQIYNISLIGTALAAFEKKEIPL